MCGRLGSTIPCTATSGTGGRADNFWGVCPVLFIVCFVYLFISIVLFVCLTVAVIISFLGGGGGGLVWPS